MKFLFWNWGSISKDVQECTKLVYNIHIERITGHVERNELLDLSENDSLKMDNSKSRL